MDTHTIYIIISYSDVTDSFLYITRLGSGWRCWHWRWVLRHLPWWVTSCVGILPQWSSCLQAFFMHEWELPMLHKYGAKKTNSTISADWRSGCWPWSESMQAARTKHWRCQRDQQSTCTVHFASADDGIFHVSFIFMSKINTHMSIYHW